MKKLSVLMFLLAVLLPSFVRHRISPIAAGIRRLDFVNLIDLD
jgi:hypothetical protein